MIKETLKEKKHDLALLGGAAPIVVILLARAFAPAQGPANASGQTTEDTPNQTASYTEPELNRDQTSMLDYARGGKTDSTDESPFLEAEATEELEGTTIPESEVKRYARDLEVSSILAGAQPAAVIGGKALSEGDRLERGWWVSSINAKTFRVTISHPVHDDVVLKLDTERR